jgi:hypothetical protein
VRGGGDAGVISGVSWEDALRCCLEVGMVCSVVMANRLGSPPVPCYLVHLLVYDVTGTLFTGLFPGNSQYKAVSKVELMECVSLPFGDPE